jgi:Protein kinase domain
MLASGTVLEGYRIDSFIGQGGMGAVYEATQLSLDRTVALKIISPELSGDVTFRERFRREGLLQAALDHPHIVPVYEAGDTEYGLFLAMRLIRGPNLKDLILARELDVGRTLRLLGQVADALDTAHDTGLVHRDIKPQNILIAVGRDHAFLADFGLTKMPGHRSLTAKGELVGTLDYISPEQIRGQQASAASDVYAFAAVLQECLTGVVPFPKDSDAAVLYAHLSEPPPPVSQYRPELPPAIDDVMRRGMGKEPEERHARAGDLIADLEAALGARLKATVAAPPPVQTPEQVGIRGPGEAAAALATPAPETVLPATPTMTVEAVRRAAVDGGAPPASPTTQIARRDRLRTMPVTALAAVAGIVVLATIGFALGRSTSEERASVRVVPRSVSAGPVTLSAPTGWAKATTAPDVLRKAVKARLELAPTGSPTAGGLVVGQAATTAPTFVPASLQRALPARSLDRRDRVRFGGLEAFRYAGLTPSGLDGELTLYVVPQEQRSTVIQCFARRGAADTVLDECNDIAATAVVRGAKKISLAPSDQYAAAVNDALRGLATRRDAGLKRLRQARTQTQQAPAADVVARAYRFAAGRLSRAPVTLLTRAANRELVSALAATEAAYRQLGAAARRDDRTGYAAARARISRAQRRVDRALQSLQKLGFFFE